jgi:hypothetical protein
MKRYSGVNSMDTPRSRGKWSSRVSRRRFWLELGLFLPLLVVGVLILYQALTDHWGNAGRSNLDTLGVIFVMLQFLPWLYDLYRKRSHFDDQPK